ncbi:MAG: galactose mutarotase [Planctomycetes bacterium GWF2_41_51]|nr:MAG: galactose mutarotase [Planctomycetes bacterium GWF2_41_51]HBG28218.1 galactose-1-epimerase [Phycisphaerales bacterium]
MNQLLQLLLNVMLILAISNCAIAKDICQIQDFGSLPDGTSAKLYTLTNKNGMNIQVTNYGGIIVRLYAPDKNNAFSDVVLGYERVEDYIKSSPYFGAIAGRYANRIGNGEFSLDGKNYKLAKNNNGHHLHGGLIGFDKVIWEMKPVNTFKGAALKVHYLSKDGEEGYPGNLDITVTYTLTNKNEVMVDYKATTDKITVCNLTQHSYFNLKSQGNGDILNHQLMLNADSFTPVDAGLITTGQILPVKGTPMAFTIPTAIGARINEDYQQLKYGRGYDHNWVLNKKHPKELSLAASVYEPNTGRYMEVWTTEPAIQFYCGNFLDGSNVGKEGKVYNFRNGFCLETQHYPDSPNKTQFPSVILKPGEKYIHKTVFKFKTK